MPARDRNARNPSDGSDGDVSFGAVATDGHLPQGQPRRKWQSGRGEAPRLFPWFVLKMRQALTFLATIENDDDHMGTLAVISILALLAISGATYSDLVLTSDQQTVQRVD